MVVFVVVRVDGLYVIVVGEVLCLVLLIDFLSRFFGGLLVVVIFFDVIECEVWF